MLTIILISSTVIALIFGASLFVRRRHQLAHEKLNTDYAYRKEPHADQVTEHPSKLRENPITDVDPR